VSHNVLRLEGIDELRAALRQLPEELTGEAAQIVEATTNGAIISVRDGYAVHSGNLRDHVSGSVERSGYAVVGVVKNTAKHAWMYENGTQARHTATGANRGSMPPGHTFIPIVARARRRMYEQLKDLLRRNGLIVSGEASS
jgi:hypothetical protein